MIKDKSDSYALNIWKEHIEFLKLYIAYTLLISMHRNINAGMSKRLQTIFIGPYDSNLFSVTCVCVYVCMFRTLHKLESYDNNLLYLS